MALQPQDAPDPDTKYTMRIYIEKNGEDIFSLSVAASTPRAAINAAAEHISVLQVS